MAAARRPAATSSAAAPQAKAGRGRPPVISSERLLEVAREVFLERGVRATTSEVAERAGVSEGTVFHRFRSKDRLFREAMSFNPDEVPERFAAALDGLDNVELRDAMIRIATTVLDIGRVAVPLMMMSWSNPECCAELDEVKKREGYRTMTRRFASYFEARMAEGKLRRMDAEIFTRAFMGTLHHYCMTELMHQHTEEYALPEGMFVRGLVDLLLMGAAPPQEVPTPAGSARRLVRG